MTVGIPTLTKAGTMFTKTTDTSGMFDASGEELERWQVGDAFIIADHAKESHDHYPTNKVFTVAFIEVNEDDFNDFQLWWIDNFNMGYVHRIDAERTEVEMMDTVEYHGQTWQVSAITEDDGYELIGYADVHEYVEPENGHLLTLTMKG